MDIVQQLRDLGMLVLYLRRDAQEAFIVQAAE
jgi:hypothetical protein